MIEYFVAGGWVMWPLAVCSALLMAVLFERTVAVTRPQWKADQTQRVLHRRPLAFINELAPSLGLLGTVIGVIESFQMIGGDADDVAAGLGVACITTVYGLLISLVCMVSGYMFELAGNPEGI
jgi:biopolymer transport protein ExbB